MKSLLQLREDRGVLARARGFLKAEAKLGEWEHKKVKSRVVLVFLGGSLDDQRQGSSNVTFSLSYPPSQPLANVRVEGSVPGMGTLAGTMTVLAGTSTATFSVLSDTPLPNGTRIYNPMNITWKVRPFASTLSCSQTNCQSAGSSSSTVYVTMATPPVLPLPLTTLGLAVASGGATSASAAFKNTWGRFSQGGIGPANVTTWDARPLSYYPLGLGFGPCATSSNYMLNVTNGIGQCGSFAFLLQDALAANGIYTDFVTINTLNNDAFLVKSWAFGAPDPTYAPYDWPLVLVVETGAGFGMVPLPYGSVFGQMISQTGLPGQNSMTPSEKVFGAHFIVKDTFGTSGSVLYYDPSYGVTYLNACDPLQGFEYKAVAGYARPVGDDTGPKFHVRQVSAGSCNIGFDK